MAYHREWLPPTPGSDVRSELIFESGAGGEREIVTRDYQDAGPTIEHVARLRQHRQYGTPYSGARQVAEVPVTIFQQWERDWKAKWSDTLTWDHYRNWQLDRPEYRKFRVNESRGTVGQAARWLGLRVD